MCNPAKNKEVGSVMSNTYDMILNIPMEISKGKSISTKWGFMASYPSPSIVMRLGSSLVWSNVPDPKQYHRPDIKGCLLRSDYVLGQYIENSRSSHAGYEKNPGTITYRGKDLGELSCYVDQRGCITWNKTALSGDAPQLTSAQEKFLNGNIREHVINSINDNMNTLKDNALRRMSKSMRDKIMDLEIGKLDMGINVILEGLK